MVVLDFIDVSYILGIGGTSSDMMTGAGAFGKTHMQVGLTKIQK